jgi:hypothetical protein
MSKVDDLRLAFREAADPESFLREHSGLPGPRANLELVHAVVEEGDERLYRRLLRWGPDRAPANTPEEFLAFCGVVGLGSLLARGRADVLPELRVFAADPRWRVREAVAIALQRWGRADMRGLLTEMRKWAGGTRYEQRAAAAALCEPALLTDPRHARGVLVLLERITRSMAAGRDRREEPFRILRQALGYCWSVAVAALPGEGVGRLDRWIGSDDPDVRWVMAENLRKKRLTAVAGDRLERWKSQLVPGQG